MVKIFTFIFPRDDCLRESDIFVAYREFPSFKTDVTAVLLEYFRVTTDSVSISYC